MNTQTVISIYDILGGHSLPLIDHDDKEVPTVDNNQLDDYDLDQQGSQADITKDTLQ